METDGAGGDAELVGGLGGGLAVRVDSTNGCLLAGRKVVDRGLDLGVGQDFFGVGLGTIRRGVLGALAG